MLKYEKMKNEKIKKLFEVSILASTISGCISTSSFAPLLGISIGTTSSATGLNILEINTGIKKYKSKKKKKKNVKYHTSSKKY